MENLEILDSEQHSVVSSQMVCKQTMPQGTTEIDTRNDEEWKMGPVTDLEWILISDLGRRC